MKRNKYDAVFSDCIRERDGWTCQVCGKSYPPKSQGLHCSHFYSRRHQATRYDPNNACAKCFSCHQRMGGNPVLFAEFIKKYLGPILFDELREKHNQIRKWTKSEKEEMYLHYKSELERLKNLREKGKIGPLRLTGYD